MMRWVRLGAACALAMGLFGCPETAQEPTVDAFIGGSVRDQGAIRDASVGLLDGGGDVRDAAPGRDAAVPCQADAECAEGEYCDASGACLIGCRVGGCAQGEACDPQIRECVAEPECRSDFDCDAGAECVDGECVAPAGCMGDADCAPGEICQAGACVDEPPPEGCQGDLDCAAGEACIMGLCVEQPGCADDLDCGLDERCVAGECLPGAPECVDDAQCGPGEACQDGACVRVGECFEDADCAAGERCVDQACMPAMPQADACLAPLPGGFGRFAGRTGDAQPIHGATCGGGATGPEVAYRLRFDADTTACLDLSGSDYDTVLYVRAGVCGAPAGEVACNDDEFDITGGVQSALTLEADAATDYFVFVDGFGDESGGYTLQISEGACAPPADCAADADCGAGQICLGGVCEDAPDNCVDDGDCAEGEACVAGACVPDAPACVEDLDCPIGQICEVGACVPVPVCADDADCALGEICEGGACVPDGQACAEDGDCAEGDRCVDGVCEGAPAACAFAQVFLPGGRVAGSSAQAPAELEGSCGGAGAEAAYRFVAGADGPVCLSTAGSAFDTVLYVREGCLGAEVACNDDFQGLTSQVEFVAAADTEYVIVVDGFAAGGDFTLSGFSGACDAPPACVADEDCAAGERCVDGACVDDRPPACQAAEAIAFGRFEGDSRLAQSAERGACGGGGGEVVRTLEVDAETRVCARTAGSAFDTVLYVRGGDCAAGEELACDDDGGDGLSSQVEFLAAPGVPYHLFIDSLVAGGDWVLTVSPGGCDAPVGCLADADCAAGEACVDFACEAVPPGACANPLPLAAGEAQAGATAEGAGALGGGCGGDGSPEQVYRFVADADGPLCLSTEGSAFDTVLYVRDGDCEGQELACNDDAAGAAGASQVEFVATAGAAYAVVVDGFVSFDGDAAFGDFSLTATPGPCGGEPPACVEDADCAAGERCVGGACVADPVACADAAPLALGVPVAGDSAGAPAAERGSCGGNGPETVFALQVPEAGAVCLSTEGSAFDTVLHVRADDCADPAAEVGCDDDGAVGLQSELELQAEPGVTYYVAVDGFAAGGAFELVALPGPCGEVVPGCVLDADCPAGEICEEGLCVPEPEPDCVDDADCAEGLVCVDAACVEPPADACGGAEAVALPLRTRGTTAGANDFQGQCGGRGPEAVYTFTAAADGVVCADTTGSAYDTLLFVREAACADGAEVACNDDAVGLRARLEFDVLAGQDYFVFVDGFNAGGDYVLSLFDGACAQAPECFQDADCPVGQACGPDATCQAAPPPACDVDADCAAGQACQAGACRPAAGGTCDLPTLIEGPAVFEGTTAGAPAAVGAACGGGAGSSEVVFELAPAAAGEWCLTTTGSLYDTVLHVRSPDCDGAAVACNDDSALAGGLQSALTLAVEAEGSYFVFVDGFGANSAGPFTLNVSEGACE